MRRISVHMSAVMALLLVVLLQPALAKFQNDFSKYPEDSQDCLYQASNSSNCNGDTMIEMNKCMCGNGGNFVTNAAACIYKSDPDDLEDVFDTMQAACTWSATPLAVSKDGFMSAANGSLTTTSSSTTAGPTSSKSGSATPTTYTTTSSGNVMTITTTGAVPTSTGENGKDNGGGGSSSTAKIGIIAGASVAGVLIIAIATFALLWYRRKRRASPGATTLSQGRYSQVSNGTELSPYSAYDEWKASGGDPKWRASSTAATTPGFLSSEWTGTSQPPHGQGYNNEQPYVFELPEQNASRPAEMPVELAASVAPVAPAATVSPYGTPHIGGQTPSIGVTPPSGTTPNMPGQQWPPTTYGGGGAGGNHQ